MGKGLKIALAIVCLLGLAYFASVLTDTEAQSEMAALNPDTENEITVRHIHASSMHYSSLDHLVSDASDIVRVEVLDQRAEWIDVLAPSQNDFDNPGGEPIDYFYLLFTVSRVRILETFKGNANVGDIIEIKQLGGEIDNVIYIASSKAPLAIGDDLVVFLMSFENTPSSLLNQSQAVFRFTPSIDTRMGNENFELESLNPQNDLTLTLHDLIQIAEDNLNW
jgi:hypothetical protein